MKLTTKTTHDSGYELEIESEYELTAAEEHAIQRAIFEILPDLPRDRITDMWVRMVGDDPATVEIWQRKQREE